MIFEPIVLVLHRVDEKNIISLKDIGSHQTIPDTFGFILPQKRILHEYTYH